MITISSNKSGLTSSSKKEGTGSGDISMSGTYSGLVDKLFEIEIDGIGAGQEVGQATFKWKRNTSSTWEVTGITTLSTPILMADGVYVAFTSGLGDDFEVGDKWYVWGINRFGKTNLIDFDRDTYHRTDSDVSSAITYIIDFGSAVTIDSLVIFDHNLSATATLLLEGNASDSWGAPTFSESITYNANKINHYLSSSQTFRYFRISITDTSNSDGYIEISTLMMFEYLELDKALSLGYRNDLNTYVKSESTIHGIKKDKAYNQGRIIKGNLNNLSLANYNSLKSMMENIYDKAGKNIQPVFFNIDESSPNDFYLIKIYSLPAEESFNSRKNVSIALEEVLSANA